jgi:hypothetical protein
MFFLTRILRRVLVLAVVLAVPLVAAEFVARKLIGDAVTSAVRARIGVAANVSLGSGPVLLQLLHGRIDDATLSASHARIGGLPPVGLTASLHDLHLKGLTSLQGAIGSLSVQAQLGPAAVRDLIATAACAGSLPADVRAALTPDPRVLLVHGRVELLPPAGRAVEVRLIPAAAGDRIVFGLAGLERDGAPAATAALLSAQAPLRCGRTLTSLPFDVLLVSAHVRDGALRLAFAGTDAEFSALG